MIKKIFKPTIERSPPLFQVKMEDFASLSMDREFFIRSVSSHYEHIYRTQKWQNHFYRFIFSGLGLLFLVLGVMIFFKSCNFTAGLYFSQYCSLIKSSINLFCFTIAGAAFTVSYKADPEKEALHYLLRKVEKELKYPARTMQIELDEIFISLATKQLTAHQEILKKYPESNKQIAEL